MSLSGSQTPEDGLYGEWWRHMDRAVVSLFWHFCSQWRGRRLSATPRALAPCVDGVRCADIKLHSGQTDVRSRCCCCHWRCHFVNGFPDSQVCISVSQLRCGDFLTLIAPPCRVHRSPHIGCWVKNMWRQQGSKGFQGKTRLLEIWGQFWYWCQATWALNIKILHLENSSCSLSLKSKVFHPNCTRIKMI